MRKGPGKVAKITADYGPKHGFASFGDFYGSNQPNFYRQLRAKLHSPTPPKVSRFQFVKTLDRLDCLRTARGVE